MRFYLFFILGTFLSSILYAIPSCDVSYEELQKITASDAQESDTFGRSVSISGDTAVVGTYIKNSAYIYKLNALTGLFQQSAKLSASDLLEGDGFGRSVSISDDIVVVGSSYHDGGSDNSGAVYIYKKPSEGWYDMNETAKLTFSVTDDYNLGSVVSVNDNVIAAKSRDNIYIYEKPSEGWTDINETAVLKTSRTPASMASSDNTVIVGFSANDNEQSWAEVFEKPLNGWSGNMTRTAKLTSSLGYSTDSYGSSVAISNNTIVIGAGRDPYSTAYIYEKPLNGWSDMTETTKLRPSDASYLYAQIGFGGSVTIDGDIVVIGASADDRTFTNTGSVYLYEKPSRGWDYWNVMNETVRLNASDKAEGDRFGSSVSISEDTMIIGAPYTDDSDVNSGSVYIFQKVVPPCQCGWYLKQGTTTCIPGITTQNPGTYLPSCESGQLIQGTEECDYTATPVDPTELFLPTCGEGEQLLQGSTQCMTEEELCEASGGQWDGTECHY